MGETDDPKKLEIKNKILSNSQRKEQAAWEAVMNSESGRRVMWELMNKFGLFSYCVPSNGNGTKMTENAARQGCAQEIKNLIAFWCGGTVWTKMEQEEMNRKALDASEEDRMTTALEKERQEKKK